MHDEYEQQAITAQDALKHILSYTRVVLETEDIKIEDSLHRVCAEPCIAKVNVPPHRSAAMDGYAICTDYSEIVPNKLEIIGESLAGKPYKGPAIKQAECIRVVTGAALPESASLIIMSELTQEENGLVAIQDSAISASDKYIREIGEDVRKDHVVIEKGKRITPADMGILCASGIAQIKVYSIPRVNFFTTGDELKKVGDSLAEGDIYNSNNLSLLGMLTNTHCKIHDFGIVSDDKTSLKLAFREAQENSDCVISTGGVSIDAHNHIKDIVSEDGEIYFHRIAFKPGRPLTFGHLQNKTLFFGLPGNPVSVMATFYLFVLPSLRKLGGEKDVKPQRLQAICTDKITKRHGRSDYQRGTLYNDEHNRLCVSIVGEQQSHMLSGMSKANCFIELSRESSDQAANTIVTVIPFSGLI